MSAQRCHCWPEDGKVIENAPPPETKEDMRGPLDLVKFKIKEILYSYSLDKQFKNYKVNSRTCER